MCRKCSPILTCSQLEHVSRVDVMWDEYFPESLKAETRSKGGKGVHRHVEIQFIPGNWPEFLRIEDKKAELFSFLATSVTAFNTANK
ncbi:30S ribosomal protein S4e [Dissostichus eleginoides]|uniref:30S ribosomal protein S4e n=1 Tax=Dissostichus eleginoides TaxID=100907 RepID=A0AAD9BSI6_DISEL|nr:30S ribosomal protein S4e [Dissostichus eleginoides]